MRIPLLLSCIFFIHSLFSQTSMAKELAPETLSKGSYALVAGGSKGIGYAVAEALARRGYNLVLVARSADSLLAARQKLGKSYGVQVSLLQVDLSTEGSSEEIAVWCKSKEIPIKMLCNVAGLGGSDDYLKLAPDSVRYMMRLNLESAVMLTAALLPMLEMNAPSHILNVGSMAGFAPIPSKNIYSATKSAMIFLSYSLRHQLKDKKISVSVLCPGPVFTKPSIEAETRKTLGSFGRLMAVSPNRVGEIAVRKTLKGRMLIVPGTVAKMVSILLRVVPMRWSAGIYSKLGG